MQRPDVEDQASQEALVVRPGTEHKCPHCNKELKFTVRELKAEVANGRTEGFRKSCSSCNRPLFVLLRREEIEGVPSVEIVDVQRYPAG